MGDDEPPLSSKEGLLEKMIRIELTKCSEPILSPEEERFKGRYSSIRNPGGVKYNGEIILLPTVRHISDNTSRLHIARSSNGHNFTLEEKPFINLNQDSLKGVEDARIIKVGEEYYITFTEFKGKQKDNRGIVKNTTRIGMVKTKDFETYYDRKIILDSFGNNKNGVIIQNKNGFYVIHRPFTGEQGEKPSARIAFTKDFENFEDKGIYFSPRTGMWDNARVGLNTPPVPIGQGKVLALYHGATIRKNIYRLGGLILDENDPRLILARSENPLIKPELEWETSGGMTGVEIPNVVFTCNLIPLGNGKFVTYYSGADKYLGLAKLKVIHI